MAVRIVITPGDSMWWLLRPEFLVYVDSVAVDPADYRRVESEKSESGYHAAVWRRLSVLRDRGVLDLVPVDARRSEAGAEADRRLAAIVADPDLAEALVADLIFAYRYWLEFNLQRLEALPLVDAYAESVREHLPLWEADLNLLLSRGVESFREQPKIIEQTARSILHRVACLRNLNSGSQGSAFASLRQFQPFIKYLELPPDFPRESRVAAFGRWGADPSGGRTLDLPVEPDLGFLSHRLGRAEFWERLSGLRAGFAEARSLVGALAEAASGVLEGLAAGRLEEAALERCARLEREAREAAAVVRTGSRYLGQAFHGVCLVPTLVLAAALGGVPPRAAPGIKMGFYFIQESLLDLSKVKAPPRVGVWRKSGGARRYTFWRAADY